MTRRNEFPKCTEYTERCGCGRILITAKQANAHAARCDQMPGDSQLLQRGYE